MKSWYFNFQVVEVFEATDGFLAGDDGRPRAGQVRSDGTGKSELD